MIWKKTSTQSFDTKDKSNLSWSDDIQIAPAGKFFDSDKQAAPPEQFFDTDK